MQPKIHESNADVKHEHSLADHADSQAGEREYQEYPKVIGRDEDGREVVAESAEHEEQLQAENSAELDDKLEDEAQAEAKGDAQ